MTENDVLFALVIAATAVQVTRATYAHLAKKHAAERQAAKENTKP